MSVEENYEFSISGELLSIKSFFLHSHRLLWNFELILFIWQIAQSVHFLDEMPSFAHIALIAILNGNSADWIVEDIFIWGDFQLLPFPSPSCSPLPTLILLFKFFHRQSPVQISFMIEINFLICSLLCFNYPVIFFYIFHCKWFVIFI